MSVEDKMLGYCPLCMQNVEHTRKFSSIFTFLLDRLTFGFLRAFRIGPYYCFQCESKSLYLRPVRRNAPTFNSQTSGVNFSDPRVDRRRKSRNPQSDPADSEPAVESVGNFLKTEHSLLMQDRRSNKFTQKFRDGTVRKILNGTASIQDVRRELEVSEADLIRWIAELVNRKEQRIEELVTILQSFESLPKKIGPILESSYENEGPIVEGRIKES
jgi:transposase-like protein